MKEEIVIKEDWKGEAIKAIMSKIGRGISTETASKIIKQITDSTSKLEINHDTKSTK